MLQSYPGAVENPFSNTVILERDNVAQNWDIKNKYRPNCHGNHNKLQSVLFFEFGKFTLHSFPVPFRLRPLPGCGPGFLSEKRPLQEQQPSLSNYSPSAGVWNIFSGLLP